MQRPKYSRKTSRLPQDRRFVKQVMFSQYSPPHWVAMDIMDSDCLLVEVDKNKMEAKFREVGLELVAAYSVQNPFLWGQFLLRSDQMKQQAENTDITVTEKQYWSPADNQFIETIVRHGFDPRFDQLLFNQVPEAGVAFYSSPDAAHKSHPSDSIPTVRYMFQAKVMVGAVVRRPGAVATSAPINNKTGLPVDTVTDTTKTIFRKYKVSETYPEYLLVYKEAGMDRLVVEEKLPMKHAKVLYLQGKNYSKQTSKKVSYAETEDSRDSRQAEDQIMTVQEKEEPVEKEKKKSLKEENIQDIIDMASIVIHCQEDVEK